MFLNFPLGKAFLYFFMVSTMLSFSETGVADILVCVAFFVGIIFNFILHFKFGDEEMDRVQTTIKRLHDRLRDEA